MKIKQVKVKELIPAEYNPRQMTKEQVKGLEESIKKFGFIDPIIVNSNPKRKNRIIGGNQRVLIAKKLSIESIPAVFVDLLPDEEKELNLRLNKNTGGWDKDLLANNYDIDLLLDIGFKHIELGLNIDKIELPEEKEEIIPKKTKEEKKVLDDCQCTRCIDCSFQCHLCHKVK